MNHLYIRLARTNMKNSRQFYIPYLLTGILSAAMFYIMTSIVYNSGLEQMRGADVITSILGMGASVTGIFICIFLFYTNSFIMKRRKKELGIYNILGMEKRHIAKVLVAETLFAALISIGCGLMTGIMFNKLLIMVLYRITGLSATIQFEISLKAILRTVALFLIIYLATLLYDMMQVCRARPIELLHSQNTGEREPKTKVLMTISGIICIISGYYISITTESPLSALGMFFIAVILVIAGTYSLFTAGSIALLKGLRKNKAFYYQTRHFTAVSGMIYRMKQNAVGLANICILSTMVLVMVSSTVCLYAGADDELATRYPTEICISDYYSIDTDHKWLEEELEKIIDQNGRTVTEKTSYYSMNTTAALRPEDNAMDVRTGDTPESSESALVYVLSREDYMREYDKQVAPLSDGEIAIFGYPAYEAEELTLFGKTYRVHESTAFSRDSDEYYMADVLGGVYYIAMPDRTALEELFVHCQKASAENKKYVHYKYNLGLDIDGTRKEKAACDNAVHERVEQLKAVDSYGLADGFSDDYRELNRADFYALNGGFLFLGIFLGTLFLMVTVLIIFYKQISEGYEDRNRFEIMEKVGMSNREVKASIRSQVRLVFILPIVTAALHVTAAFPLIQRLLMIMNLTNSKLFALCLAGTVFAFSVIYLIVFLLTSRSYYKIVGNQTSFQRMS